MGDRVLGSDPFKQNRDTIWKKSDAPDGLSHGMDEKTGGGESVRREPAPVRRCAALTGKGRPCRNKPLQGSLYCSIHTRKLDEKTDREKQRSTTSDRRNAFPLPKEEEPGEDRTGKARGFFIPDELRGIEEEMFDVIKGVIEQFWIHHHEIPKVDENRLGVLMRQVLAEVDPSVHSADWFNSFFHWLRNFFGALFPGNKLADMAPPSLGSEDLYRKFLNLISFFIKELSPKKPSDVDDFGFDEEYTMRFYPFFDFMYSVYWRVDVEGIENVPDEGRALMVANHSGVVPWDSTMLIMSVLKEHPNPRFVRCLMLDMFTSSPYLGTFFCRTGQVRASRENGVQLLERGNLVAVFPEGLKGIGKLFSQRYKLQRFGRGGYIKLAVETGAPIIPVSVIGAEEIYPLVYRADWLAKVFNFPYFPITITFPWMGLLGLIPLPTKWLIEFGRPVDVSRHSPKEADNEVVVQELSDRIKNTIQDMIYKNIKKRKSVFWG